MYINLMSIKRSISYCVLYLSKTNSYDTLLERLQDFCSVSSSTKISSHLSQNYHADSTHFHFHHLIRHSGRLSHFPDRPRNHSSSPQLFHHLYDHATTHPISRPLCRCHLRFPHRLSHSLPHRAPLDCQEPVVPIHVPSSLELLAKGVQFSSPNL